MIVCQKRLRLLVVALFTAAAAHLQPLVAQETSDATPAAQDAATGRGQEDLDEALRLKITSNGLRDLNAVITKLETAIEKGLNDEDNDFAERMLSDSLMERATSLMQVISTRSLGDDQVQKIRALVTSDLRNVLAYDDPPPSAFLMLGKLQALPYGDPREARRAISNYLKFEELPAEKRAEALVLRARMIKDESTAIADMKQAIELVPENSAYRLAMAVFLRQANKLEEALFVIDEVLQQNPDDGNAVLLQGEIYRQQNDLDKAVASFDRATEIAPKAPGPFQNRGEIYRQQGKFDAAINQFNEVLKLQPGVLLTLLHRADAYLGSGKYEEALADIEVVLEKQPLVAAHRLRAEILTKMDRLNEAVEEMERVSAAMPNQPELKMQLALYYLVDKLPSKAIAAYSDVLDLDRNNFAALQARGDAYLNIGKHAEAIADFNRALKLKPEDTTLLNNLAWVLATSPEEGLRDGQRAIELATKASEMTNYKTPHILSTLAAAYAEVGDFETAIKWSQESVDLNDPEHGEQLVKELESYRQGKPWREIQSLEEKSGSPQINDTSPNSPDKEPRLDDPTIDSSPLINSRGIRN